MRRLEEAALGSFLGESDGRFRQVFQAHLDALTINSHPDGKYLEVNDEFLKITGFRREEVLGRTPVELNLWADAGEFKSVLHELREQGIVRNFEARFRLKDGRVGSALFSAVVVELGGRLCVVSFVRDVTERNRAQRELEESRRAMAMAEKLSALGTLVSGVAHEIRTPCTYIANNLFLLEQRLRRAAEEHPEWPEELWKEAAAYCSAAREGVARIDRLLQDVRRFTRCQPAGRLATGLDEVTREAVDLFRSTHRGREEVVSFLQPTPPVELDRRQIETVVLNLLSNAAEAMPGGGTIRVFTRAVCGGAEIEVEDEGTGIPPEVQTRLFDPFFTTKADGTGLGLSIARRIVDAHGGTIRFETSAAGSRFSVFLPEGGAGERRREA